MYAVWILKSRQAVRSETYGYSFRDKAAQVSFFSFCSAQSSMLFVRCSCMLFTALLINNCQLKIWMKIDWLGYVSDEIFTPFFSLRVNLNSLLYFLEKVKFRIDVIDPVLHNTHIVSSCFTKEQRFSCKLFFHLYILGSVYLGVILRGVLMLHIILKTWQNTKRSINLKIQTGC